MEKNPIRLLLAEDDRNLGSILKNYLDAKGYATTLCVNGQEAVESFLRKEFDICILDVMMPVKDGFAAAEEIRAANRKVPILFLTAKTLQEDKLKGFEIGADDYITKPFSMEELLLRMQAILRRMEENPKTVAPDNIFQIGNYVFDYNRQSLTLRNMEQKLTSKEAGLLKLLCLHANDTLDRHTALKEIWHADSYFNARSMDVYVVKLRKYLKDDPRVELLNVHGVGFKLVMNI
ncbi:MAG TPA: response regulator transcription factor [Bacteroidales bacterium]|nr:response regulator transcription factor [Bacteroidales bacterium]HPS63570.1 response regulator transcription factor [Bacteroidales bacterium]